MQWFVIYNMNDALGPQRVSSLSCVANATVAGKCEDILYVSFTLHCATKYEYTIRIQRYTLNKKKILLGVSNLYVAWT